MDKLDNEYLVFTSHDTSTKFNDFSTYYIPDSILIIGDKKDPEYWKDENAQTIINAFKTKMNAAGYTAVDKDDADLGLQVSYVASTYYFHGYYNDGPWWGYYPGYWYPGYWGGCVGGRFFRVFPRGFPVADVVVTVAVCLAADGGGGQFAPAVAGKAVVDGIPLAGRAPRNGPCQAVVSVFPRYGCISGGVRHTDNSTD